MYGRKHPLTAYMDGIVKIMTNFIHDITSKGILIKNKKKTSVIR